MFGSTGRYYRDITEHILVLRNLFLYKSTLKYYNLYWYFVSYTCTTKYILVLRNLFLCEGTRRYDKSEQIIIILNTRLDQTYVDTYQIWTLVHRRYRSQQIHIPDSYRFRTYISNNKQIIGLNHNHIQSYTCLEVPVGTTELILILQNLTYFTDTRVPVGTTELDHIQEYP